MHADRVGLRVPAATAAAPGLHVVYRPVMHDIWDEKKGSKLNSTKTERTGCYDGWVGFVSWTCD
jgi:hypothetical protein